MVGNLMNRGRSGLASQRLVILLSLAFFEYVIGKLIAQGFTSICIYATWASFCLLLGLVIVARYFEGSKRSFLTNLFVAAFVLRLVLMVFNHRAYSPSGIVYPDEGFYLERGSIVAEEWKSGKVLLPPEYYVRVAEGPVFGYLLFNAVHFIFFESALLPKITNCLLGALLTILIFRIAERTFDYRTAKLAAVLVAFMPDLVYFSAVNLKDILVAFLTCLVLLMTGKFAREPRRLLLGMCLVALLAVRFYVTLLLIGIVLVDVVINRRTTSARTRLGIGVVILLVISISFSSSPFLLSIAHVAATERGAGLMNYAAVSLSQVQSGGYFLGRWSSVGPAFLLVSFFHFLTTPSPYRFSLQAPDFGIGNVGGIVWYLLLPYFILGTYFLLKRELNRLFPILAFVWGSIVLYAFLPGLGDSRHRAQFMPLTILISAVGMTTYQHRHKKVFVVLMWAVLFVGVTFFEKLYW